MFLKSACQVVLVVSGVERHWVREYGSMRDAQKKPDA